MIKRIGKYMKFVLSFSCGKDSVYALSEMLKDGHEAVALIVSCSKSSGRSFFHGADEAMLDEYSKVLNIPIIKTFADGEDYSERFEEGLVKAKEMGAEAACFGDIGLLSSKKWNEARAKAAGLSAVFPLWKIDPNEYMYNILNDGYKCLIKVVDLDVLSEDVLGKDLDETILQKMEEDELDICGENGEYHTLVMDCPLFSAPIKIKKGAVGKSGHCAFLETILD